MSLKNKLGSAKGTATLEFIAVFPFLMLILLVGVELSRAWLTANLAQNAVREGARIGAVTPAANVVTDAANKINDVLSAANLTAEAPGPSVTCNPAPCDPTTNSRVETSVTVKFQTIFPRFFPAYNVSALGTFNITQRASMRYE